MIKSILVTSAIVLSLILFAGGSPSKGTKADKRLKGNKSQVPQPPKPPTPKKG